MFSIDFEDPKFQSILRIVQYVVLSALVVGGTFILVMAGQGYDVNRKTGEVIQNGLVLINSSPVNATVAINGNSERDATPGRFALPAGDYRFSLNRQGYREWVKNVSVSGSGVEWLYYPLLIPNSPITTQVGAFRSIEFISQSPDAQKFLIRQTASDPSFLVVSVGARGIEDETRISLNAELLAEPDKTGSFRFEGWANNNRHALLRYTYGESTEYIWLDTVDPSLSRNLTQDFDLQIDEVRFIDGNSQQLYALNGSDLRRFDLTDNTVSAPIARDVKRYILFTNRFVLFIAEDAERGARLGYIENNSQPRFVAELPEGGDNYLVEFAEFDNDFYLALVNKARGAVRIFTNPHITQSDSIKTTEIILNLAGGAQYLSFSRNGQFVAAQNGSRFVVYDLDYERRYAFQLSYSIGDQQRAQWLDGYRLYIPEITTSGDSLHIFEFDGTNDHSIAANIDATYPVLLANNASSILTVSKTVESVQFLQRTNLLVEP